MTETTGNFIKKIILPGLLAGAAMLVINLILGLFIFDRQVLGDDHRHSFSFVPATTFLALLFFSIPILSGLLMALVWSFLKRRQFGKLSPSSAGVALGFAMWLPGLLGMVIYYLLFPVSFEVLYGWIMGNLIVFPLGGVIITVMNKYKKKAGVQLAK